MKYNFVRYCSIALILFVSIAVNTFAQDGQITASAPSSVVVGQSFNYTISGDFSGDVELPSLKGFRLVGGPSTFVSQQSSFINGRMESTKTVTYTYVLLAQDEGEWVIPSATVTSGRKTFKTNEVSIKVVKSSQAAQTPQSSGGNQETTGSEKVFIRQIPSKSSVYQGEQLVFSTKIYTQEALNISNFKGPGFDGFWRNDLDADNNAQQERINGQVYLTQVFKRELLTAQKSGPLTIAPADIECAIRKKVSRGRSVFDDPFGDPFFDRYENVIQGFKSNSVTITVKPLPSGAPEGFNGAVGSYKMKAEVNKTKLKVNEAVSLKLHISGSGNIELIKPVKINFPPDLEVFDPKSNNNFKYAETGTSGTIDFEYILIPRHAGNFRIAPVVFAWFDPSDGKYKSEKSSEFTFAAEKGENDDPGYYTSNAGQQGLSEGGKEVASLAHDIRFIRITPPGLKPIGKSIFGSTLFIFAYIFPVIILLAIIIFRRERIRRNADINAVRNRKARKLAEKRLKNASLLLKSGNQEFYDEILKAVWGYLADKLGISVSELSREKIATELQQKKLEPEVLQSLWNLLDECEIARYASSTGGDKQKIYNDAIALISVLQEKIR